MLISAGSVLVDGCVCSDQSRKTRVGQVVEFEDECIPSVLLAECVDFKILYEDSDIIVVDKPAGVVVHPGAGNKTGTLVNGLLFHSNELSSYGEAELRPGIVHRIDKDTSGVLVVAKTDCAHAHLAQQFAEHSITRIYECFVYGVPNTSRDVVRVNGVYMLQTQIGRDVVNRKRMKVIKEGGKHAITMFKILDVFKNSVASRVECELKTGRTHQIRVHMSYLKAPLIGDQVYGKKRKVNGDNNDVIYNFNRQALHAKYLKFKHPITLQEMEFLSEIPHDMCNLNSILSNL